MNRRWSRGATLALSLALWTAAVEGQTLVIGGFPSVAPWALVDRSGEQEVVVGGIVKDLADQITLKTGIEFTYYFPPRKRMEAEIAAGRLDVIPTVVPGWLENPEALDWSPVVLSESMVFVSLVAAHGPVTRGADLRDRVVGMISGYVYPELPPSLGYLREDTATLARNLAKLEADRLDLVYGSDVELAFRVKQNPGRFRFEPWSPVKNELRWAVAHRVGPVADRVLTALTELVREGKVATILQAYR